MREKTAKPLVEEKEAVKHHKINSFFNFFVSLLLLRAYLTTKT